MTELGLTWISLREHLCHGERHYSTDFASMKSFNSLEECKNDSALTLKKYHDESPLNSEIKVLFRPPITSGIGQFVTHYMQNRFEPYQMEKGSKKCDKANHPSEDSLGIEIVDGFDISCFLPKCLARLINIRSYKYYWEILTPAGCSYPQHLRKLAYGPRESANTPQEAVDQLCHFYNQNVRNTAVSSLPMEVYFCIESE